jgi:hypothetical protein
MAALENPFLLEKIADFIRHDIQLYAASDRLQRQILHIDAHFAAHLSRLPSLFWSLFTHAVCLSIGSEWVRNVQKKKDSTVYFCCPAYKLPYISVE